ncbi:MAG: PAS domain S-box protein [Desulfuromusa sp.]|nr:PAS domain S-box protein [Desulfuromusa sp.]
MKISRLQTFQKNIIAQIILLLCLFMISFAGLHFGQGLLNKRRSYLQMLQDNEQVKTELSHILQKKILAVNVKLHDMSNATSIDEMRRTLTSLSVLKAELMELLVVLDQGGKKTVNNLVNFGFDDGFSHNLTYVNFHRQGINVEILELRAKLIELDDIVEEFQGVVEQKIYILESGDLLLVAGAIQKVSNYYKGIEPFFNRILKNSSELFLQSFQERARIQKVNTEFNQKYRLIENTSQAVAAIFILLMGTLVLNSSRKILLDRQRYQQRLLEANKNLEEIVHKRTSTLEIEVAERKKAESKITEQADFLLNIIESLSHPFYVIDANNYSIVLANSAALKNGDETSKTCHALTHHQETPCAGVDHPCPLQIVKKMKAPVAVEHIHRNKQGEETFVEIHGYPVFDADGNLVQMIEYSLDITDKKNAEKALKAANEQLEEKVQIRTSALEEQILQRKQVQLELIESERHYRRLIENISDVITIVDIHGTVFYASPSAFSVLGFSPENVIGHNIREFVHPEDLTYFNIEAICERYKGISPVEYRILNGDGEYRVFESIIRKFEQEGSSARYILSSRDVTLRKINEEETRKLQMVVEQSPSSIVITDIDGTIEYVNPAFTEITGYSFTEAVGQNPRVLKSEQTPEQRFTQLWETITAGNVWRGEFTNKKKNGELYIENVLVVPIKNTSDEITHFVAVKENITELKRARKIAVQANQAKSNFLSQMSHELRTPLNAINGFSQLMLKSKKNPLNEKQKGMTEQIQTAGQHLLQLINEVLDLARIESGEFSLSVEPLDPHVVLEDCLALISPLAEEKSITITNQCDGKELPLIRADLTRVKQVVLNFLSNAVKYNNSGGSVIIDVETDIPEFLRFVVVDNGTGIPEDKQKDIFTPFTRAVENPDDIEGTGIGMTITKQLVEKMGGDIGFESQLGEGSTFWFTLPVAVVLTTAEGPVSLSEENKSETKFRDKIIQQKLILYVEDNPANVTFMQEFFSEQEGFQLVIAMTGEEGVSKALKNTPDLILLDLNLPGIDGFQAYRQLKANPKTEFVPVIVVSANAMEKTVRKVHKMGFDGYVPKPIDIDLLRKTIADILGDST